MKLIEAGHYYTSFGPTRFSQIGWGILKEIHKEGDKTLLFKDDVHSKKQVSRAETVFGVLDFVPNPRPDFIVFESEMTEYGLRVLEMLKVLSRRKRAKHREGIGWFCGKSKLTDQSGEPLCVLFDAGLCLWKLEQGFSSCINILPWYYEEQQLKTRRICEKVFGDSFVLRVVLFDEQGNYWNLGEKT